MLMGLQTTQTDSFFIVPKIRLSEKELYILKRIAEGEQLKNIAFDLNENKVTVAMRIFRAKKLNNAKSTINLIVMAMRTGKMK